MLLLGRTLYCLFLVLSQLILLVMSDFSLMPAFRRRNGSVSVFLSFFRYRTLVNSKGSRERVRDSVKHGNCEVHCIVDHFAYPPKSCRRGKRLDRKRVHIIPALTSCRPCNILLSFAIALTRSYFFLPLNLPCFEYLQQYTSVITRRQHWRSLSNFDYRL